MGRRRRGSRTHGKGSQKKGRGAGNRGGRGKAGSWKHEKFPLKRQGKYGFKRPQTRREETSVINVGQIDESVEELVTEGIAERKGDAYHLDASELGVDKLLGAGRVNAELHITVEAASESAVRKVEEVGGAVEIER
ncbi:MAG: 50S ribosomal protein L15 [Methanonatronarchaeales archaeon]|nr:50S ribosomal protein L15 [Methanonatronarchaeales archaeon]